MPRFVQLAATFGLVVLVSSSAAACPFCNSNTAEQVRAGIFNSDFGYHLGVSLTPFFIFNAVLFLVYYLPIGRSKKPGSDREPPSVASKSTLEQT